MAICWRILLLLFLIRSVMAFQFATIGAIAPLIGNEFQVDAVAIGALIGIYFSPGMVWDLFNAALAIVFSFSPTLLVEGGLSLAKAGASTSLVMWGVMVAGILAPQEGSDQDLWGVTMPTCATGCERQRSK